MKNKNMFRASENLDGKNMILFVDFNSCDKQKQIEQDNWRDLQSTTYACI